MSVDKGWRCYFHILARKWQVVTPAPQSRCVGTFKDLSNAVIARNVWFASMYGPAGLAIAWMVMHSHQHRPQPRTRKT